ncbi:MAG: hypothetical protein AAFN30_06830 [Actinomycetota bacterium]
MRRARWLVRAGVAAVVALSGAVVGFGCSSGSVPVDEVRTDGLTDGTGGGPIFYVEVRSRPDYRLYTLDPETGSSSPVFEVAELGAISSVAATPDGRRLALAYTTDYTVAGNGLYTLAVPEGDGPVDESALEPLTAELDAEFYDDLAISPDGSTLWASVGQNNQSRLAAIDIASGATTTVVDNAVAPAPGGDWVAYLPIEADGARRSVAVLDLTTDETRVYPILDGRYDLGHLLADEQRGRLWFTALIPVGEPLITFGEPAGAHGSHDGPSQWLVLDLETGAVSGLVDQQLSNVRDSVLRSDGALVESNPDGLVLPFDGPEPVLASRVVTEIASTPPSGSVD